MDIQRPSRKKEIRRRRFLIGAGVAALLVLLTMGIYSLEPAVRSVERGSIWFDTVERGEMLRSVRGNGTLVAMEIRWISAQTDGRVERRVVEAGARVTPETVILELSNPELEQSDDRRMVESLEDRPFPSKPPAHRLIGKVLGAQHLDRHFGSLDSVDGFEHITHRTAGHFTDQLVAAGQRGAETDDCGLRRHCVGTYLSSQSRPTDVRCARP